MRYPEPAWAFPAHGRSKTSDASRSLALCTATELHLSSADSHTLHSWASHAEAVHDAGGPANGVEAITAVLESQSDYFRCAPTPLPARHAVHPRRASWLASAAHNDSQ